MSRDIPSDAPHLSGPRPAERTGAGASPVPGFLPGDPRLRRTILGLVGHILEEDGDILTRWRARLTASILLAAILIGVFPAYNTFTYLVLDGADWQVVVNMILVVAVGWFLLSRRPSTRLRGWFLAWSCISVGVVSITTLGPFSAALAWLYTGVMLATFLLGPRSAALALGVVLVVLTGVCVGIERGILEWADGTENALLRWRMVAYNVGFLMVILAGANTLIMHLLEEEEGARTAAEHRLSEARRHEAVGTLASGIAHDFNNLLVPIFGNLDTVRAGLDPGTDAGSEAEAALADVERAALRGRDLVQRILTFGRSGLAERRTVDVASVAREVVRPMQREVPPGVRLVLRVEGDPAVHASEVQLYQVIQNLVQNACQAVGGKGTVQVDVRSEGEGGPGQVRIRVTDDGVGMSPQTRDRVFDPYFTTREGARGTGLGLPIVRSIVGELGGEILVESEVGRGSVFRVDLPAANPVPPSPAPPGAPSDGTPSPRPPGVSRSPGPFPPSMAEPGPWGPINVLVVDDEAPVRLAVARMLASLGCQVTQAASPAEAGTVLGAPEASFDLLLTDFRMPGGSGVELIQRVRQADQGLAVLLTSGNLHEEWSEDGDLEGVTVLQKPFSRDQLALAVQEALAFRQERAPGG